MGGFFALIDVYGQVQSTCLESQQCADNLEKRTYSDGGNKSKEIAYPARPNQGGMLGR